MTPVDKDPDKIAKEIDLSIRLSEIREESKLKETLVPRFYDLTLLATLFTFGLGLALTMVFALPQEEDHIYYIWLLWGGGFLIITLICFEYLIRKFRVVRRVLEITLRRLEKLDRENKALKKMMKKSATKKG